MKRVPGLAGRRALLRLLADAIRGRTRCRRPQGPRSTPSHDDRGRGCRAFPRHRRRRRASSLDARVDVRAGDTRRRRRLRHSPPVGCRFSAGSVRASASRRRKPAFSPGSRRGSRRTRAARVSRHHRRAPPALSRFGLERHPCAAGLFAVAAQFVRSRSGCSLRRRTCCLGSPA